VMSGQDIFVRLYYESEKEIQNALVFVSFNLRNNQGVLLTNMNSVDSGFSRLDIFRRGYFECRWPKFNLRCGDYDCNLFCSVIVATHNRADTIRRCLYSALGPTVTTYEVIVVDDASTDDTTSVVKSISDERLQLITMSSNKGAQAARNVGIKNAKGDYIAFLDSDDEWVPEKLEWQTKEIARMEKPCVIHGAGWIYKEQENTREIFSMPILNGFVYKELLTNPGPLYPCLFVPKKNLVEIGFLDEKTPSFQEWDLSITLAKQLDFVFIDKPL